MDSLWTDLRYAVRTLRQNPAFTLAAVAMLALGIGVNAIVFSVTNAALLKGFPLVADNDRLLYISNNGKCCVSYPDFNDWREQTTTFGDMALVHGLGITLADDAGLPDPTCDNSIEPTSVSPFAPTRVSPLAPIRGSGSPDATTVVRLKPDATSVVRLKPDTTSESHLKRSTSRSRYTDSLSPARHMDRYRDLGLLILRIGFGLAFFWYHGYPKLAGGPEMWARIGDAVANIGITFAHPAFGLAAALAEGVGGLLFAAGLFFRPVCLAMLGVMVMATIDQLGREMPQPEHALKNAFVLAGMFFVGPGRYTVNLLRGRIR